MRIVLPAVGSVVGFAYAFIMIGLLVQLGVYCHASRSLSAWHKAGFFASFAIAGIVCSRIGNHLIFEVNTPQAVEIVQLFSPTSRGYTILGFIVGPIAILGCCAFGTDGSRHGVDAANAYYLSLPVGQAIGRGMCLLSGCCFGGPTGRGWGVVYPPDSVPGLAFGPIPLHPAPVYEAQLDLCLFLVLLAIWQNAESRKLVCGAYLVGYGAIRAIVQSIRVDNVHARQRVFITCTVLVIVGVGLMLHVMRSRQRQGDLWGP